MIEAFDLRHAYGERTVVSLDHLRVGSGEELALIGPSGSGKTTLLHILGGLLAPDQGRVVVDGEEMTALQGGRLDRFRGRAFGVVFQDIHLVPAVSVVGNLRLAMGLSGSRSDAERLERLLDRLGLGDLGNARPRALSRGEAQRAAIARAVIHRPKVLLADEPTSALDDDNAASVITVLRDAAREANAALIVATHDARVRDLIGAHLSLGAPKEAAA